MSKSLSKGVRYRDRADECRRLAALMARIAGAAEISRHYQQIADHYEALAEAEELLARAPPASGASRDGQSQR